MCGRYPSGHLRHHKDAKPPVVIYLHEGRDEDGGKVVYAHYVCHSCGAWRDRWCARVDAGTGRAEAA